MQIAGPSIPAERKLGDALTYRLNAPVRRRDST
jgi:hypothetical protein